MIGATPESTSYRSRRNFLIGSAASAAAALGLYSTEVARHEIDVVHLDVPIRRLPDPFAGFRIVQISDIHFDQYTEPGFLSRVLTRINSLAPDMVLLTGDFVSRGPMPVRFAQREAWRCSEVLRSLACALRFAILGNHDTVVGSPEVIAALASSNIPTLVDRYLPIERDGKRLWLSGVNDPGTEEPRLDRAIPTNPDGPVLLMAHEPDYVDRVLRQPEARRIDLMLSGHSHGGQVRLPGLGPLILPPMGRKYVEGHFRFGPLQLYVNRGIGTVGLPIRLNCPPEITVLTLHPDKA
jgi:predicted MPP superfamily phosphohydrolase